MSIPLNTAAFRDIFMKAMRDHDELERTTKGRRQLAASYRAEAKQLRESSGIDLWRDAGGEQNTHVASPAELARRAIERAVGLEKQADELDAIRGENFSRYGYET